MKPCIDLIVSFLVFFKPVYQARTISSTHDADFEIDIEIRTDPIDYRAIEMDWLVPKELVKLMDKAKSNLPETKDELAKLSAFACYLNETPNNFNVATNSVINPKKHVHDNLKQFIENQKENSEKNHFPQMI